MFKPGDKVCYRWGGWRHGTVVEYDKQFQYYKIRTRPHNAHIFMRPETLQAYTELWRLLYE